MAQIDDIIATYLNAVETEGKAVRTIKSYRESLADFRRVGRRLGFPDTVEDYGVTHVYAFLADLRGRRGRSGRTNTTPVYQNHHHRTLKAFFSWCRRMSYLDPERTHVFARVPLARIERKVPRPFSEEEIERLLAGCDRTRLTGCRNYALLLFLLDNGMRSQECAAVVTGSVKSQGALRKRSWGSGRDRWASRRSHLREQRTPTRRKEPPLLSERHRVASPAAPTEVLPQLVERRAEARRRREAPEAAHRVVPLLHRAMVLLHEVV